MPCRLLRSRCLAQDACLQRNAKTSTRQTSDEALEPKPVNRKSNPSSPCSGSKRTPMRPAALPGSRISETRETTDGSAELKFRIQFPPAESRATFRPELVFDTTFGEGGSISFPYFRAGSQSRNISPPLYAGLGVEIRTDDRATATPSPSAAEHSLAPQRDGNPDCWRADVPLAGRRPRGRGREQRSCLITRRVKGSNPPLQPTSCLCILKKKPVRS